MENIHPLARPLALAALLLSLFTAACGPSSDLAAATALPTRPGTTPLATLAPALTRPPTALPNALVEPVQVFFSSARGQAAENGPLEQALLADLQGAQDSIDLAMYNFSLKRVADALIAAKARGLRVRMVTDSDALDGAQFPRLKKGGIPVLGDRRESLMHDKFVIIDQRLVWTGSLNLTASGAYQDNNNFVRFDSPDLAENYTREFEEMFTQDKFGAGSPANTPYPELQLAGIQLENYFAPEDRVFPRLVALLRSASQQVDLLAYSFTSDPLAEALLERARAGVAVRGVFDQDQYQSNQGGEFLRLQRAGLAVRLDGNPGLMHEKVIIIDSQVVIFGSYNFTASADRKNDENVVVIHSAAIARLFESEFERVYAQAKQVAGASLTPNR